MKCPSCLRELPDQSRFCGYCGVMIAAPPPPEPPSQPSGLPSFTVQPDAQAGAGGMSAGIDAELPVMQTPAAAPPPPPEPEPEAPGTHAAQPEEPADAQPEAQEEALPEEPLMPSEPASPSPGEGSQPAAKKKAGPFVIVIAAAAVLLIVAGLIWALPRLGPGASSEALSTVPLLVSEDGMLVASGKKALELADDTADYSGWSALCYTMDGKLFVYYDEIDGDLATLYIGAAGGRARKIDTDAVVGQILVRPGAVLYLRREKKSDVLCLYDGREVHELSETAQGFETWCCSDDGSFVSYATRNKNGDTVGVYRYKGKDYTLNRNTTIVYVSPNGKAAYAADTGDEWDGIIDTLYALVDYEKIEAVAVGEDVVSVLIDRSNNAVAFLGDYNDDNGTGDFMYAKWGKKAVEIDSKVSDLCYFPSGELVGSIYGTYMMSANKLFSSGVISSISESFRGELYYVRKDTLMVSPFKRGRSVELIDDISEFHGTIAAVRGVLYWQDRKDIASYRIGSFSDPVEWRADAIGDGFIVLRDRTVLSIDDDELFIQTYGSDDDAVLILDDIDDYMSVGMSPDQKLLYYLEDDELYYIPVRGGKPVRVIKDVEDICLTSAGVYILADYDAEDGGEVFFVGYGKANPVSIAKDIMRFTVLVYGR